VWDSYGKPDAPFLVKYGKRIHLEPMLQSGVFRLSPASRYRDSENPAIRDTELEFTEELYGAIVSAPENGDYCIPMDRWKPIPMIGTMKGKLTSESDYYTACFSNTYNSRLFDDFDADACILIKDPMRFVELVRRCASEKLPDWRFSKGNVSYRDPFQPTSDDSIVYAKHFRYWYQNEFRFAWQSPANVQVLEYLSLTLGSLRDFCDLLAL